MNNTTTFIISMVLVFVFTNANAQQHDLLLYNNKDLAQSSLLNPATRSNTSVSVGLFHAGVMANSSAFSAYDVMGKGTVFNENVESILSNLGSNDFVRSNVNSNILFTSFNVNSRLQISFGGMVSVNQHMEMPENLVRLMTRGNAQFENELVEFGGWATEMSTTTSIHAGASYVVNDKLTVGLRLYRHNGVFNAHMRRQNNNININFDPDVWNIETDVEARSSFIGGEVFDETSDGIVVNDLELATLQDILNLVNFQKNIGYSVDLGAEYKVNNKWSVSASILGLGGINYNANSQSIGSKGTFEYDGIRYNLRNQSFETGAFIDSLSQLYNPEIKSNESYRRSLPTQVFTGVQYDLSRMNELHGIMRYTSWLGRNYFDFNLRYVFKPTRFISAMANISTAQGSVYGGGLGLQVYVPGFQFFVMADVMTNNVSISHFRGAMVQTGVNIAFWDRSERRARKNAERETERDPVLPAPDSLENNSSDTNQNQPLRDDEIRENSTTPSNELPSTNENIEDESPNPNDFGNHSLNNEPQELYGLHHTMPQRKVDGDVTVPQKFFGLLHTSNKTESI